MLAGYRCYGKSYLRGTEYVMTEHTYWKQKMIGFT